MKVTPIIIFMIIIFESTDLITIWREFYMIISKVNLKYDYRLFIYLSLIINKHFKTNLIEIK